MRVLVTGGAGFVGANLALWLSAHGHEVVCMDNLVRRGSELNVCRLRHAGVRFVHGDCRCLEDYPGSRWGAVCHTAAQPSAIDGYQDPVYDLQNNVAALFPVLEICRRSSAKLIYWASNKVYPCHEVDAIGYLETPDSYLLNKAVDEDLPLNGNDRSLYGATKLAGETLALEYGRAFDFPVFSNRFSCLAGPWQWGKTEQGWLAWWVIAHQLGFPLAYYGFGGKQTRDVLHVRDVCSLVIAELNAGSGGIYNVGGGETNVLSLRQATELCIAITGKRVRITTVEQERPADFRSYISDISKVERELRWRPAYSPVETIDSINDWAVKNIDTLRKMYA